MYKLKVCIIRHWISDFFYVFFSRKICNNVICNDGGRLVAAFLVFYHNQVLRLIEHNDWTKEISDDQGGIAFVAMYQFILISLRRFVIFALAKNNSNNFYPHSGLKKGRRPVLLRLHYLKFVSIKAKASKATNR